MRARRLERKLLWGVVAIFVIPTALTESTLIAEIYAGALEAQGVKGASVGPRAQSVLQTALVVRDPSAPAMARLKELQGGFPGSELKVGACDKTS